MARRGLRAPGLTKRAGPMRTASVIGIDRRGADRAGTPRAAGARDKSAADAMAVSTGFLRHAASALVINFIRPVPAQEKCPGPRLVACGGYWGFRTGTVRVDHSARPCERSGRVPDIPGDAHSSLPALHSVSSPGRIRSSQGIDVRSLSDFEDFWQAQRLATSDTKTSLKTESERGG